MKISGFADVCLRILMRTSTLGTAVTTRELAEQVATPYHHATKAVVELRRRGLVDVTRGAGGGVAINAAGRAQSVGGLLRDLDADVDGAACTSPSGDCALVDVCQLRGALRRAKEAFYRSLDDETVESLTGRQPVGAPVAIGVPSPSRRS